MENIDDPSTRFHFEQHAPSRRPVWPSVRDTPRCCVLRIGRAVSGILAASATGHAAAFSTIASAGGTKIAFERRGSGPALILIGGGLNDRAMASPLADLLAGDFSVYTYDRRGRGDSTDTAPYAVNREVEDLAALIGAIGVPVAIFGHSSGAILALEAATQADRNRRGAHAASPPAV